MWLHTTFPRVRLNDDHCEDSPGGSFDTSPRPCEYSSRALKPVLISIPSSSDVSSCQSTSATSESQQSRYRGGGNGASKPRPLLAAGTPRADWWVTQGGLAHRSCFIDFRPTSLSSFVDNSLVAAFSSALLSALQMLVDVLNKVQQYQSK
jgi:hypothetical protein